MRKNDWESVSSYFKELFWQKKKKRNADGVCAPGRKQYDFDGVAKLQVSYLVLVCSGVPRGDLGRLGGGVKALPRSSEGPPKSYQTQPD